MTIMVIKFVYHDDNEKNLNILKISQSFSSFCKFFSALTI